MKLVMTLLVRNEEDILLENILYHLEQGVDHFLITDNLSIDKTKDIINDFVKKGLATYIYESDDDYNQAVWVTKMAQIAYEIKANWVIHSDADEFWFAPDNLTLKKFIGRHFWTNILYAKRSDFICLDFKGVKFWEAMIYKKKESLANIGGYIGDKVAHRTYPGVLVSQGNHDVSGIKFPRKKKSMIEILHFPLRTRAQYLKKIENGGASYANNKKLPFIIGETWRTQYKEYIETGTIKYMEDNIYNSNKIEELLANGNLYIDDRLKNKMRAILGGSVSI